MAGSRIAPVERAGPAVSEQAEDKAGYYRGASRRRCTDCGHGVIFSACWVALACLTAFAWSRASPTRVLHGADSFGNTCGSKNERRVDGRNAGLDMTDYPNLLFLDPGASPLSLQICVKSCPVLDATATASLQAAGYCLTDAIAAEGPYRGDWSLVNESWSGVDPLTGCPPRVYASLEVNHRCLPASHAPLAVRNATWVQLNRLGLDGYSLCDIDSAIWPMIYITLIAFGCTLGVNVLMAVQPHTAVLVHFALSFAAVWCTTGWLWHKYDVKWHAHYRDAPDRVVQPQPVEADINLYLVMAIITTVAAVMTTYGHAMFFRRAVLASAFLRGTARVMQRSFRALMLVPIFILLIVAAVGGFFYWTVALMLSQYSMHFADDEGRTVYFTRNTDRWIWFTGTMCVWTVLFILALEATVLAHAAVGAYFDAQHRWTLTSTAKTALRYYGGSAVLGSVLTALTAVIRPVTTWCALSSAQREVGSRLPQLKAWRQWIISFGAAHHVAYADAAVYGRPFNAAASHALAMLYRNAPLVGSLQSVTWYIMYCGKIFLISVVMLAAIWWFEHKDTLYYPGLIVMLTALLGVVVAEVSYSVYAVTADAVLLSFCEDATANDGSKDSPYCAPSDLLELILREERRFQHIREDIFKQKIELAMLAKRNYESSMLYNVDKFQQYGEHDPATLVTKGSFRRKASNKRMRELNKLPRVQSPVSESRTAEIPEPAPAVVPVGGGSQAVDDEPKSAEPTASEPQTLSTTLSPSPVAAAPARDPFEHEDQPLAPPVRPMPSIFDPIAGQSKDQFVPKLPGLPTLNRPPALGGMPTGSPMRPQ